MNKLTGVLIFLLFPAFSCVTAVAAEVEVPKRVRVIFGYDSISVWDQNFITAVNQALLGDQRVLISTEFIRLDADDTTSFNLFSEIERLRPSEADLVIAAQPAAAKFVHRYRDIFFPDIPRLHVIPDSETANDVLVSNSGSLVPNAMTNAARDTLELMPRLLPGLEHIYVLSGNDPSDLTYLTRIQDIVAEMNLQPEIHYLVGLTPTELISELNANSENSAALISVYDRDRTGQVFRTRDIVELINDEIRVPLFAFFDTLLNSGVVGGNLTSATLYGEKTAELTLSILFNEPEPETLTTPSGLYFDAAQLDRWGIDYNLLPAASELINVRPSLIQQYWWQLILGTAVFLIQLYFIVALMRSLRRRKKAEKERDQKIVEQLNQERLFESVINSIPDAIFITDAESKIFATNIGAQKLFNFASGELLGHHVRDLLASSAENNEKSVRALENSVEPQLLSYTKKGGSKFSGETIATQITSESGQSLGHFALIRDVSKRLSLEEEQRQGQKMEALGNLVGGVSHDFNNILGVISGYAELLLLRNEPESLEENQRQILKATDRAKSLVAQIMTFSRDASIEQKPIDLAVLLDDTMELINISVPRSIRLALNKSDDVQPVMGASIQLQQIILNLTTNACQAMNTSGGTIAISLDRLCLDSEMNLSHGVLGPGSYSVLSVSDTGPGMSERVASRIFEPYFTTKLKGDGSGMGLATVYNLAKVHDAMLDLKTAPGEGTCFTLYFKEATEIKEDLQDVEKVSIAQGHGEHILLVDDEEDLLDATRRLLTATGYRVSAFHDPVEALRAFARTPEDFDLLLTDQSMPKFTGIELLKEIRKLDQPILAIICTGYSDVIDQDLIEQLKLHAILQKPYTLSEVTEVLEAAIATIEEGLGS